MPTSHINNKRIAKNTLFLYLRMIVVMAIGLYMVRAILSILGVVDYGIYNVVGGVVSVFSFLNSTLATSSQRYFSIELSKGDMKRLNQWVCLNITTFSIFILIFLAIAETLGLWFVNTQMTIPEERMFAANVVYQLSILSFCIHFFNVPYNALIIAHERMSAFAYISIIEAVLKLVIVFLLKVSTGDKLIIYGILLFLVSCVITSSYIIYCLRHFAETKFRPYWNTREMKELISFSGWHFWGTFSTMIRSQGINILLNLFFNPAINAARAVAFQVYYAVSQLSNNFFVAVKPQIYKSYAVGDTEALCKLVLRSTIMSSFLVSILIYPILSNTAFILGLWLKQLPEYVVIFTQLVLINGLIDATNGPAAAAVLATGKIRSYELAVATTIIMNLPISYIALKLGADPTSTLYVSIVISLITTMLRSYIMCRKLSLPYLRYVIVYSKLIIGSIVIALIMFMTIYNNVDSIFLFIGGSALLFLVIVITYMLIVVDKTDRKYVLELAKTKFRL